MPNNIIEIPPPLTVEEFVSKTIEQIDKACREVGTETPFSVKFSLIVSPSGHVSDTGSKMDFSITTDKHCRKEKPVNPSTLRP